MGMFDTVNVPCPECGEVASFQSKGGECLIHEYELSNAPPDVLLDVNRHAPHECEECGTLFAVRVTWKAVPVSVGGGGAP